ncbi:hypothetical protein EV202_1498 [Bacteroides heparinolyticus]|uniref:Uncharacterized protein n=1 Tax=Prevotella heparinolytica TaxID=28113 RepID=A0A4R2LP58_9BACE|nr:hypothetical protein [Bacteroides heparinolyticus]TCO85684.1 hypothetical protein EV202_1498 [Bacteroides heparinolyticus]
MEKEKAERAKNLLDEIDRLHDIKDATEKESSHWWSFLSPDTKRWSNDGLVMPDILRQKFVEAVDAAITEKEYELKEL